MTAHEEQSLLCEALEFLVEEFVRLGRAWTCERERAGLRHAFADARHHLYAAVGLLDQLTDDPAHLYPHSAFEIMSDALRVRAHEAFVAVLGLGRLVRRAADEHLASQGALADADLAVWRMLEELTPYVSRADGALRRTLLADPPLGIDVPAQTM